MENGMPSVSTNMVSRNPTVMDGIALQTAPNSIMQYGSFHQNQTLSRYTALSTLQGEPTSSNITSSQLAKQSAAIDSDMLVTFLERDVMRYAMPGSLPAVANSELQDHLVGETPISSAALAPLLATGSSLQENLSNLAFAGSTVSPFEVLRPCDWSDSFASTVNYDCYEVFGSLNGKEDSDRFPAPVEIGGKVPASAAFQRYSSIGNLEPNSWISLNGVNVSADNAHRYSRFSNELSLSLATSQPSIINGTSITDQCSEISSSDVAHHCLKGTSVCSERGSYNYKELSLSCDSSKAGQFSQVISESRYLHVIQDILSQIARCSLENLDQMSFSSSGFKTAMSSPFSLDCPIGGRLASMGSEDSPSECSMFHFQMDPALQKRALEAKKTQLLTLLRLVDDRYNQCLDEIHTVISAFHAATELDPQIHTRFALQTITFLYKSLRERISNQILSIGAHFDTGFPQETEGCFDSYFQKQWTLQQLKKKDQLWRPQRGLPERSVSILRTWMFQNFLHPYPKDADKHLLAVKSGLTRSQVSNWFINARVRLWKPMIEDMYAEMNRRKARHCEDGTNGNLRSHIGILSASPDSLLNQS